MYNKKSMNSELCCLMVRRVTSTTEARSETCGGKNSSNQQCSCPTRMISTFDTTTRFWRGRIALRCNDRSRIIYLFRARCRTMLTKVVKSVRVVQNHVPNKSSLPRKSEREKERKRVTLCKAVQCSCNSTGGPCSQTQNARSKT